MGLSPPRHPGLEPGSRCLAPTAEEAGPRRKAGATESGFTLIEMMISLLIFGLLAAAGVTLLSFSVRAQTATGSKLDDASALARLSSALTADLAQATPRRTRGESGEALPSFTGEGSSSATPMLRFVRGGWSNLDGAHRAGAQKVEYRVENNALVRIAYPMLDGAPALPPATMLDRVSGVALRYRTRGAWSDRWIESPAAPLPEALELRIVRTGSSGGGTEYRQLYLVGTGYGRRADASR